MRSSRPPSLRNAAPQVNARVRIRGLHSPIVDAKGSHHEVKHMFNVMECSTLRRL